MSNKRLAQNKNEVCSSSVFQNYKSEVKKLQIWSDFEANKSLEDGIIS